MKRLYFRDGSRTTLSLKITISSLRQSQKHFEGFAVVVLGVVVLGVVFLVVVGEAVDGVTWPLGVVA